MKIATPLLKAKVTTGAVALFIQKQLTGFLW